MCPVAAKYSVNEWWWGCHQIIAVQNEEKKEQELQHRTRRHQQVDWHCKSSILLYACKQWVNVVHDQATWSSSCWFRTFLARVCCRLQGCQAEVPQWCKRQMRHQGSIYVHPSMVVLRYIASSRVCIEDCGWLTRATNRCIGRCYPKYKCTFLENGAKALCDDSMLSLHYAAIKEDKNQMGEYHWCAGFPAGTILGGCPDEAHYMLFFLNVTNLLDTNTPDLLASKWHAQHPPSMHHC